MWIAEGKKECFKVSECEGLSVFLILFVCLFSYWEPQCKNLHTVLSGTRPVLLITKGPWW